MSIASFTLVNTGSAPLAAGFVTEIFGHPFKKGDIPAGNFPEFRLSISAVCEYSWGAQTHWSDGSLKFASFMLRVPMGVPVGGSLSVNIGTTTIAPAPSSRTLAEVAAASDLKVSVTGLENLTGAWVSSLNQGIADNDDVKVWMDGAAGKIWRIRQQFMAGGANHGQLECYWYVGALQSSSGTLAGITFNARLCQPWYDVDSPPKAHRTFSEFKLFNGATPIRDCAAAKGAPRTFTWISADVFDCSLNGVSDTSIMAGTRYGGFACQLSSTGTLPAPLKPNTTYFLRNGGPLTSKFKIGTSTPAILSGLNLVTPTDAGSGVHTLNIYPRLCHFSSMYTCGGDGQWDSLLAPAPTVRFKMDAAYWISTGIIGSYETKFGAISSAAPHGPVNGGYIAGLDAGYVPNGSGSIATQSLGQTGELPDLGLMPAYYVSHLVNQLAADERLVRVTGLCDGHFSLALRNAARKSIPGVNNTAYPGMPSQLTDFAWRAPAAGGFTAPPDVSELMTWGEQGFDHMPELSFYPYVRFGRPEFLDQLAEKANSALLCRPGGTPIVATGNALRPDGNGSYRNYRVAGTDYWGCTAGDASSTRGDGWATRTVAQMAGICPDAHYECASYKQYFNDVLTTTCSMLLAWTEMLKVSHPFYYDTGGMAMTVAIRNPAYHRSYWAYGIAAGAGLAENAAALGILNYYLKRPAWLHHNFGGWHTGHDYGVERIGPADGNWVPGSASSYPLPDDAAHIAPHVSLSLTWNPSGFTVTLHAGNGYVPTAGDRYLFFMSTPLPAGFSAFTPYYVVSPSGLTFQLAATPGGAPITITDINTTACEVNTVWANPGPDRSAFNYSPDSYPANHCGSISFAAAVGATVDPAMLADLRHRRDYGGSSPAGDLKYELSDSFVVGEPPATVVIGHPPPPPPTKEIVMSIAADQKAAIDAFRAALDVAITLLNTQNTELVALAGTAAVTAADIALLQANTVSLIADKDRLLSAVATITGAVKAPAAANAASA